MQRPIVRLLICALAMASLAAPAMADVYRWVDANGKVHYSDTPPPEGAERLSMGRDKSRVPPPSGKQGDKKGTPQSPEQAQAALQKTQCEYWQARLNAYQSDNRIVVTDDDGSRHELTADEKAKEIKQAKSYLDTNCGK